MTFEMVIIGVAIMTFLGHLNAFLMMIIKIFVCKLEISEPSETNLFLKNPLVFAFDTFLLFFAELDIHESFKSNLFLIWRKKNKKIFLKKCQMQKLREFFQKE